MSWWQNIPFFSILLFLFLPAVTSVLRARRARALCLSALTLSLCLSVFLLGRMCVPGTSAFTFRMGHFPAPWGNEIRCGRLEAFLSVVFQSIMFLSLLGGSRRLDQHIGPGRENLFYALCQLMMAALLAQIYSNDLFTCYVFLEIMTLSACALIISRSRGRTLISAMRYMVLNLVGSGLFLFGVVLLYDMTGHLLMEPLGASVRGLYASGAYHRPLVICVALVSVGLAVKSALFPFHTWAPDAYSNGTPASNAILSSLVSKGYILLLLKIYSRVFGWDLVRACEIDRILMAFALGGMILGSLRALQASRLNRMISWSSVAQIGYIFLGLSLGTRAGSQAAVWHLMVHAASKALLFLSCDDLRIVSGHSSAFPALRGAARRAPLAGTVWTMAAFSMVGLPFTGGLVSKLLLGQEALRHSLPVACAVLSVLTLSTLLNVLYFLRAVILIWSPSAAGREPPVKSAGSPAFRFAVVFLALLQPLFFLFSTPLLQIISAGLSQFS